MESSSFPTALSERRRRGNRRRQYELSARHLRLESLEGRCLLTVDLAVGAGVADAEIAPDELASATSGLVLTTDDIVVPEFRVGERGITATVDVAHAEAGTVLDAWIDFDGDGAFGGVRERIAAARPVSSGEQTFVFDAPATTASGTTQARFRLSTPDDPAFEPIEQSFEVTVLAPIEQQVFFTDFAEERVFAEVDGNTRVVEAIDFDGDGDTDLITRLYSSVYWMERTDGGYVEHEILYRPGRLDGLEIVDIDSDGDLDLVTLSAREPIVLHLNDGSQDLSTQIELVIPGELVLHELLVGDIEGDGDFDLVVRGCDYGCDMFWYEQSDAGWVLHSLPEPHLTPIALVDADADGDLDLFADGGSVVSAYEFDVGFLAPRVIADSFDWIRSSVSGDVDGDGDIDLLVADRPGGFILENQGGFRFEARSLTDEYYRTDDTYPLQLVDVTGDGLLEAIYHRTIIRISDGAVLGFAHGDGIFDDVDQDGDLDIVAAQWDFDSVYWVEHVGAEVYLRNTQRDGDFAETFSEKLTFRVERTTSYTNPIEGPPIRVEFAFTGGATLGEDFVVAGADEVSNSGGYFTIPENERYGGFEVTLLDDDHLELDETLRITFIENGEYAVRGRYDRQTDRYTRHRDVNIVDDDPGDFGDAPAIYNVGRDRNGAKHGATGPLLGELREAESDGLPSADANGEGAEDDGVIFGALQAGQLATVTVHVTGADDRTFVDAWIDFDRDGEWGPLSDLILASAPVVNGDNQLTFRVPAGVKPGETFARVRLSETGGLSPYGPALTGEVEDYAVTLSPPPSGTGVFKRPEELLADEYETIIDLVPADVDGDGDQDLVVAGSRSWVTWWSNDGSGGFRRAGTIDGPDDELFPNTWTQTRLHALDFDRDGDVDFIGSPYYVGGVRLYENTPTGFLVKEISPYSSAIAGIVDADRDGAPDLNLRGSYIRGTGDGAFVESGATALYDRPELFEIDETVFADLDHDGTLDAVAIDEDEVRWYRPNERGVYTLQETVRFRVDNVDEPSLIVADVDADPFPEVIALSGRVSALIVGVNAEGELEAELDPGFSGGGELAIADLDADGDLDFASTDTPSGRFGGFGWFAGQPDTEPLPITLSDRIGKQKGVFAIDIDSDGDLDLVSWGDSTGVGGSGIFIHEQVNNTVAVDASQQAISEGDLEQVTFTARRSGPLSKALAVPYNLSGAADAHADYIFLDPEVAGSTTGDLHFAPDQAEVSFRIIATPDGSIESNELLTFAIGPGADYRVGDPSEVSLVIVDDELADFGDAPSTYPTGRFQDGARHQAIGPKLGAVRHVELDGAPAADTDPDDDGLASHGLRVGAHDSYLLVDVSAAPSGARLDAWVDFDGDGTWTDAGEKVAASVVVENGRNAVVFVTPPTARSGPTYARIRISKDGGLGSLGAALDGEVEDHRVVIEPPAATPGTFGPVLQTESGVFQYGYLLPHDLDRDGDLDFIEWKTSYSTSFVWIENLGADRYVRREPQSVGYSDPEEIIAGDVTGDGLDEVVVRTDDGLVVFSVTPSGFTQIASTSLKRAAGSFSTYWVRLADLNGDGKQEIMVATSIENVAGIDAFVFNGGELVGQRIAEGTFRAPSVADLDGDGRADIVSEQQSTSSRPGGITLLIGRIDGGLEPSESVGVYGSEYALADVDADGDIDIVYLGRSASSASSRERVSWLENDGSGRFVARVLISSWDAVRTFQVADLNGDGLVDVIADFGSHEPLTLSINVGDGEFAFRRELTNAQGLLEPLVADFDSDGDLDLIAGRVTRNDLLWAANLTVAPGDYTFDGVVDQHDWKLWNQTFGSTTYLSADGNGNGVVDAADYALWRDNVGVMSVATDTSRAGLGERMEDEQRTPASTVRGHRPQVRSRFRTPDHGQPKQRTAVADEQAGRAESSPAAGIQRTSAQEERRLERVDAAFARLAVRPQLRAAFRRL